ncbi:MAG: hypothetical protein RLZZ04_1840 [Cyanobacteriota bacterium]|jgi:hypothetical protein
MFKLITPTFLHLLVIPSIFLASNPGNGQTSPSPELGNFPLQNNEARTSQPSGTFFDPNSGSRQFFQQGREQLYFLPTEKSTPILKIDDELQEKKPKASPRESSETEQSPVQQEIHELPR